MGGYIYKHLGEDFSPPLWGKIRGVGLGKDFCGSVATSHCSWELQIYLLVPFKILRLFSGYYYLMYDCILISGGSIGCLFMRVAAAELRSSAAALLGGSYLTFIILSFLIVTRANQSFGCGLLVDAGQPCPKTCPVVR